MKNIWQECCKYTIEFKINIFKYILLFFSLEIFNLFILIPVFRVVTNLLLQELALPLISYQNVLVLITSHLFALIILVAEVIGLFLIIYSQFAFLLLSIRAIKEDDFKIKIIFQNVLKTVKKTNVVVFLLFILEFFIIIALMGIVFRSTFLAKLSVLRFVLEFTTSNSLILIGSIILAIIILFLMIKLAFVFPLIILEEKKARDAIKISWELTKGKKGIRIFAKLLMIVAVAASVLAIIYFLAYAFQLGFDRIFTNNISKFTSMIILLIIQLISEIMVIWFSVLIIFSLMKYLKLSGSLATKNSARKYPKIFIISSILVLGLITSNNVVNNYFYIAGESLISPKVISHRGVSQANGVQNTIPAFNKTKKLNPDYIEIDLHETKDHQFIVIHDESLNKLTDVSKTPRQLTLKQLKRIKATEDGHQAKLATFDDYLEASQKENQKLLIEIKTTSADSKKMLERFNKKYGQMIIRRNYQVQSLDYTVVQELNRINPKIYVIYILPYDLGYPQSVADGYSMRYSTLSSDFVWQAHVQNKKVYAWTVNKKYPIKKMLYNHVDGVITDDIQKTQAEINDYNKQVTNVKRIWNYIW